MKKSIHLKALEIISKFCIGLWFILYFFTFSTQPAHAMVRWIVDDSRVWGIGEVCRDGAELIILHEQSTDPPLEGFPQPTDPFYEFTFWFDASIYVSETPPDYDDHDGLLYELSTLYIDGEHLKLTDRSSYTAIYHEIPYAYEYGDVYVYGEYVISWSEFLPIGTPILFDGRAIGIVEDCIKNELIVNDQITLNISDINAHISNIDSSNIRYEVISLPEGAEVQLDNVTMNLGEFFTQEEVSEGKMTVLGIEPYEDTFLGYVGRNTTLASVNSTGTVGNQGSRNPSITSYYEVQDNFYNDSYYPPAIYIAFQSDATNLVDSDTNNTTDIFRHDIIKDAPNETSRVSVTIDGDEGDATSRQPKISINGHFISFDSDANLIQSGSDYLKQPICGLAVDNNNLRDIYTRHQPPTWNPSTTISSLPDWFDCTQYTTQSRFPSRPSPERNNFYWGSIVDPTWVSYSTNNQIYLFTPKYDLYEVTLISSEVGTENSPGDGLSAYPAVSLNGEWITYHSVATNLVSGDTNDVTDVFLRETEFYTSTIRISEGYGGAEANGKSQRPTISTDGRYVAFRSEADNLLPTEDSNGAADIFVYDRLAPATEPQITRVSVWSDGSQMNGKSGIPEMSTNGRFIAFQYVPAESAHLSCGNANGAYQIFVHDRDADNDNVFDETHEGAIRTYPVSVNNQNELGNDDSCSLSISPDGNYVSFSSYATNLVEGIDTNGVEQVYVHHQFTGKVPISVEFDDPPVSINDLNIEKTDANLQLDWSSITENTSGNTVTIDYYNIYRSNDPYFVPDQNSLFDTSTDSTYTDGISIESGNEWYYSVTAVSSEGIESAPSNQVGMFSMDVQPDWNLFSLPIIPIETSLDSILGTQLFGTEDPQTADRILIWNTDTQSYDSAWFCGGPICETFGDPFYNHWLANDFSQSPLTLEPDSGFWLQNRSGGTETFVIVGQLANADREVSIESGYQLLGSAFPISKPLDEANVPATGTEDPQTGDRILYWDAVNQTYESAWFCGGSVCETFGEPFYNHWLANDYSATTIVLEPGHGFWYQNRHDPLVWENLSP